RYLGTARADGDPAPRSSWRDLRRHREFGACPWWRTGAGGSGARRLSRRLYLRLVGTGSISGAAAPRGRPHAFGHSTVGHRAGRNVSSATPAATLRPACPCTERGCSAMVRSEPPTSTLAPRPAPTVASAVAPA